MKKHCLKFFNRRIAAAFLAVICVLFAFIGCKAEAANTQPPQNSSADEQRLEPNATNAADERDGQTSHAESGYSGDEDGQLSDDLNEEQAKSSKAVKSSEPSASKTPATSKAYAPAAKPAASRAPTTSSKPQKTKAPEPTKAEELKCTLAINCKTILDNIERFDSNKLGILPKNGVIYSARTVTFTEGETVFDVLVRETKKNRIHMEHASNPMYNSEYIEGIANIYEKDCGEASGWMYKVNGKFPNYGCSQYKLKAGDKIEWLYTCDLGHDLGRAYQ